MDKKTDQGCGRKRCSRRGGLPFTLRRFIWAVCGPLLIALLTAVFLLSTPSDMGLRTILDFPALGLALRFIRGHGFLLVEILLVVIGLVLALRSFLQQRKKKYPEFWGVVEIGNESYLVMREDKTLPPEKKRRVFCDGHTESVTGNGK